jgi:hypothetical protein
VRREAGVAWTETPGRDATDPLQGVAGMAGDFEVIFHGEIYASMDPVKVRSDMGRLFRQPAEKVHQLFDGRTWVLKDGLDREPAERYQVELAKIGVISELRDRSPAWKPEKPADPHSKSQNFTLESIAITRMTCPECQYAQLEADYCARCGTNIEVARAKAKLQAKEDDAIAQRIRQGLAPFGLHVGDDNLGAFAHEQAHRRLADAAGAAGDHCHFIVEIFHVLPISIVIRLWWMLRYQLLSD